VRCPCWAFPPIVYITPSVYRQLICLIPRVGPRSSAQPWALLHNRVAVLGLISQRDFGPKPRVARNELPWVHRAYEESTPKVLCIPARLSLTRHLWCCGACLSTLCDYQRRPGHRCGASVRGIGAGHRCGASVRGIGAGHRGHSMFSGWEGKDMLCP
jgi:hypothetical protein